MQNTSTIDMRRQGHAQVKPEPLIEKLRKRSRFNSKQAINYRSDSLPHWFHMYGNSFLLRQKTSHVFTGLPRHTPPQWMLHCLL